MVVSSSFAQPSSGLWLHTSGLYIYDENNQRIDLRGVNTQFGSGEGLTAGDIESVKQLGFNVFRLSVYWGLAQPYNESLGGIDQSYFTTPRRPSNAPSLDWAVSQAVQNNMYVILDLFWSPTWGPPSWAFPGISNDGQRFAGLISGTASKERTGIVNTWKFIANRYKGTPNVIFELLNEPNVVDHSLAGNSYKTFNEGIISAIEQVETQSHLKVVQFLLDSDSFAEILETAVDVNKPNTIRATHNYSPMSSYDPNGRYWHDAFTWRGNNYPEGWGNGTLFVTWRLVRAANIIHGWNRPWIITEFSKDTTQPYWHEWLNTVLDTQAEYNAAGFVYFCYANDPNSNSEWNINNAAIQQRIIDCLRPYLSTLTVRRRA